MGLKLLHSADWHLDSPFGALPEAVRQRMKEQQRRIPGEIADLCIQEGCDLVLLSGDLFDGQPSRETVETLKRALARCRVPVFISPGNHDFLAPGSPWRVALWPENVHIFTGDLGYFDLDALDCRIYGAGYRSMDCPGLLADFHAQGEQRYSIAVLHGDPLNSASPCCPITAAQVRESGLDYLALGHIHKAGSFRAGDTLCAWPGCPMGRGWDETGEKGTYIVTLEESAEIRWVPMNHAQFHEETVTVSGNAEAALEAILPPGGSCDLYRITLTGTGNTDIAALERRYRSVAYLELRDETQPETDPFASAGEDSLRGVYFRLLQEQLAQASPEQTEIIRLAAALSQDLLDGKEAVLP